MGKVERASRALCYAAGSEIIGGCPHCDDKIGCMLWKTFRNETRAVIRALKQEDDNERAYWPKGRTEELD